MDGLVVVLAGDAATGLHRRNLERADTVAPEDAKLPEPTFQEKIAALQSKFRGIS